MSKSQRRWDVWALGILGSVKKSQPNGVHPLYVALGVFGVFGLKS